MGRRVVGSAPIRVRQAAIVPSPPPLKAPAWPSVPAPQSARMQLRTPESARKYLTAAERDGFLRTAEQADRTARTLCMVLAHSGCRLSEALALITDRVDLGIGTVVFESLKKCRDGIYRAVPVPPALLEALVTAHGVCELQGEHGGGRGVGVQAASRVAHSGRGADPAIPRRG